MVIHKFPRNLATAICGRCDQDIEFLKPCYFWPLDSPFACVEKRWTLLCQECFGLTVQEDVEEAS